MGPNYVFRPTQLPNAGAPALAQLSPDSECHIYNNWEQRWGWRAGSVAKLKSMNRLSIGQTGYCQAEAAAAGVLFGFN